MIRNLFDRSVKKAGRKARTRRSQSERRRNLMRPLRVESLEDRILLAGIILETEDEIAAGAVIQRTMVYSDIDEDTGGGPLQMGAQNLSTNGLEFSFNPAAGTPANVISGFAEAGDLWSSLLTDDIMVNVDISFPSLGPGILGSTSTQVIAPTYAATRTALVNDATSTDDATATTNLPAGPDLDIYINRTANNPNGSGDATPYVDSDGDANNVDLTVTRANAKAIGLVTAGDAAVDASIAFSSNFTWDFDRSDGITPGAFDFIGVAAHEIGHVLGFVSGVDVLDGNSPPVNGPFNDDAFTFVNTLDFYRYSSDSAASSAIDWTADIRDKFLSLDAGTTLQTQFAEGRNFGDGQQASHWKDNLGLGIMDPTLAPGEFSDITANDLQGFDVIGWDLQTDVVVDINDLGNDILLQLNPTDNTELQLAVGGIVVQSFTAASLNSLTINGLGGDDTLTVDYSNGDPIPSGGLTFDAGESAGDNDTLVVTGYNVPTATSTYTGAESGTVAVGTGPLITYTGLEPLTLSGTAANLVIDLSQTGVQNTDVALADDAGAVAGVSEISGSTFENTTFANPTANLSVLLGPAGDTLAVGTMDAAYGATLNITGGNGNDTVTVKPSANFTVNANGNLPTAAPGDVLIYDGSGAKTLTGSASGVITGVGVQPVNFIKFEQIQTTAGNTLSDVVNVGTLVGGADGNANEVILRRDAATGTLLEVLFDGDTTDATPAMLISSQLYPSVGGVTVNGSGDDDLLTVDNANGYISLPGFVTFAGAGGSNMLAMTGNAAATTVAHEIYAVGATEDAGTWTLDVDGIAANGDEVVVNFSGLAPVDTDVVATLFDVILTGGADNLAVQDGGLLNGNNSIQVTDNGGTFETFRFANKTNVRINGLDGADRMDVDYTTTAVGLASLQLYGHDATGTDPTDDNIADDFNVMQTPAGFDATALFGGGGNDTFDFADAGNTVDDVFGNVTVNGDAGDDLLTVGDTGSAGGSETVTLTGTTIAGITGGGLITYNSLNAGTVTINASGAGNTFNVQSTAAGLTSTTLNLGGGSDTVNIDDGAGTANGVISPIILNGQGGDDTLNIEDTADAGANVYHMDATDIGGGLFGGPVTTGGIFGAGGILHYGADLEVIVVNAGNGANTFNIDGTGVGGPVGTAAVTINDGSGASTFHIQSDQLAATADHTFNGAAGTDTFMVHLANGALMTGNTFVINGDDPNNDPADRDIVTIIDAGGARTVQITYQSAASGDVDVTGLGTTLDANTVESLNYVGDAANDDQLTVFGTGDDDDLTVAPQSPSSALVFLGGNPWDGPVDVAYANALPGMAGGSAGPDIQLGGLSLYGLTLDGGAGTNRLYVYAPTETDLSASSGVVIPGVGAGNAYDQIYVSDSVVSIDNVVAGPLVNVNIATPTFVQAVPTDAGLIVNAGIDATFAPSGVADDITADMSANFAIQINGQDPDPINAPNGDRLHVWVRGDINIYSDKLDPVNVTITSSNPWMGVALLPLTWSSIESTFLYTETGVVNMIGDQNDPDLDQNDNFVVTGANLGDAIMDWDSDGANELFLEINGSAPVGINNVSYVNVFGDDQNPPPGRPSSGPNDIDTLEITPYADNRPTGWDIDVRFDEGNPAGNDASGNQADLLIYHTAVNLGVSEDIVVQPSDPEAGELRSTNGAFGTPIVAISYVNNLDLIILDDDADASDTDTLLLKGTSPDNPGTSGEEAVTADFTAAGTLADPLVVVEDSVAAAQLYRVRNIDGFETISIDTMGGDDTVSLIGRDNGSLALNVANASLVLPGTTADDGFTILPGTTSDSGMAYVRRDTTNPATAATPISFTGTDLITVSAGAGAVSDTFDIFGTGADNTVSVFGTGSLGVAVQVDAGPFIDIDAIGSANSSLSLHTGGGDDNISIATASNWQLGTILVDGGLPSTGSDSVEVLGTSVDDTFGYEANGASSGALNVTSGGATTVVSMVNVEHLAIDALDQAAADALEVTAVNANVTLGSAPGTGTVEPVDAVGAELLAITYGGIEDAAFIRLDPAAVTVVVEGTPEDDLFNVSVAGMITRTNTLGFDNSIDLQAFDNLVVNTLGGNDTVTVASGVAFATIQVIGGEPGSGSDMLVLNSARQVDEALQVTPNSVPGRQDITGLQVPVAAVGVELIAVNGNAGETDTLQVNLGSGDNTAMIEAGNGVDLVTSDSLPEIVFAQMEQFQVDAGGGSDVVTFKTRLLSGAMAANYMVAGDTADRLVIEGSGGQAGDAYRITNPAVGSVAIEDMKSARVTVTATGDVNLVVDTLGGDDQVTIDVNNTDLISVPITIHGGANSDSITLVGAPLGAAVDASYQPGPAVGEGRLEYVSGSTMTIDFTGLEPILDAIPGTLTVFGSAADNAINYQPSLPGFARVTVDEFESIEFGNKTHLTINAAAGDDVVNLNNPVAPVGLTDITVIGNDATAGDVVIVNGTTGGDGIGVLSIDDDSSRIAGVQGIANPVFVDTVESLLINGLGGNDILTLDSDSTLSTFELTPGSTVDSGDVQVNSNLPISFTNLGAGGMVHVLGDAGGDSFIYNGTQASDTFTVGGSAISLNSQIFVITNDVEDYTLRGFGGDDTFNVLSLSGINLLVEGDEPSGSDTLNFMSDGSGNVVVELDADLGGIPLLQTIQQQGGAFGVVTHTGIETANLDLNGGNLYVAGTRAEDVIEFTPLSAESGMLTANLSPTTYFASEVAGDLVITGGGTGVGGPFGGGVADKVIYNGTNGADWIHVNTPARIVELDGWRAITLDDAVSPALGTRGIVETVEIRGRDGNDTIHVTPGTAVGDGLFVNVDGGSPQASDALVISQADGSALESTDFVVVGHSRNPDAGNILVYRSAARLPSIAFEDVEVLSPNVADGDHLLILGPDVYEQNEYHQTAAYLGSGAALNVENLAIFPSATEHPGVPADQDYFRVVAEKTGTLDFQIYFHNYTGMLPGDGQLTAEVLDASGTAITPAFDVTPLPAAGDARVRIPAVAGQTYYLHVSGATTDVVNGYDMTIVNTTPPVPYDIELVDLPVDPNYINPPANNSDTGRSHFDDVTYDSTPAIIIRLDDGIFLHDLPGNPATNNPPAGPVEIPFNNSLDPNSTDAGYRVAVYVEGDPQQPGVAPQQVIGYAQPAAVEGVYTFDFGDAIIPGFVDLSDGSHFISARVEMIDPATPTEYGYGDRSESLEIVVDTEAPDVTLLEMVDDDCAFNPVHVTSITKPSFYGVAEANSILRIYVDLNGNGTLEVGTDFELGKAVAIPTDGNNQFPNGYYEFTTPVDLNDPVLGLPFDGLRTIFATGEDLAGNITDEADAATLRIFLDTQGPRITDVYVTSDPGYALFGLKENPTEPTVEPTPLITQISIDVRDLPNRLAPDFLYPALVESIAENPGHYHLIGDANGEIPIESIVFTSIVADGQPARGTIVLTFTNPLPDDRFTLTVEDDLVDPACNNLDGESNAEEPQGAPQFPTGDGVPGHDFVARFTVDTRPEIGVWAAGNVWVDTNGNSTFDPTNLDYTNRDIIYQMGYTSDDIFAGNFALNPGATADGFDKLAAYGRVGAAWRWLVDTDNDGVANVEMFDHLNINGLPVAGRFDPIDNNGDEVGVFTGDTWYFDRGHDFQLDADTALATDMRGYPIVGDFDGDGFDDLATWADDQFQVDLANGVLRGWDGVADQTFRSGFIGVRERPVAADMDADGFDDFGLWVPDRSGALPESSGEWYFLVSDGQSVLNRIQVDPLRGDNVVPFTPIPFGADIYAQFGDQFALPIVGNFDPPVAGVGSAVSEPVGNLHTNLANPMDVNADGDVTPLDALVVINFLNKYLPSRLEGAATSQPYLDVDMNGFAAPLDALLVINFLNDQASEGGSGEPGAEGEAASATSLESSTDPQAMSGLPGALPTSDSLVSQFTASAAVSSNSSDGITRVADQPTEGQQQLDQIGLDDSLATAGVGGSVSDGLLTTLATDTGATPGHDVLDSIFEDWDDV